MSSVYHGQRWFLVDSRGHVRAYIRRCGRAEAEALGEAMFGERMCATARTALNVSQRAECLSFRDAITLEKAKTLFGIEVPKDIGGREKAAALKAWRAGGGR